LVYRLALGSFRDLETDPHKMVNLAAKKETHAELILAMNVKLEAIKAELGVDNGREMPDFKGITWTIDTVD
jgi:arylsulfatase